MMASVSGQARLFLDNFDGTQTMSYDFGCPRQMIGDDPYPDPSCNQIASNPDTTLHYNDMGYQGCYSDQTTGSGRALAYRAYTSANNSIEMCTLACVNAGYSIAGMEYADGMYLLKPPRAAR